MDRSFVLTVSVVLALAGSAAPAALGQTVTPAPAAIQPSASPPAATPAAAPQQPVFSTEQLDQLTAPIALYPDELVAQILIAASYPLEIVLAERWLSDPAHAQLKGDQLAAALQPEVWDPSVKSLVPYPQVLKMMSDQLDWTQKLGDAFLAQQADVMSSVQRLRQRAQSAGTLKSTEQQTVVVTEKNTVVIQPANPQVVYVPAYNPTVVYGPWPYPAYPPPYYPPPPAYYPGYDPGAALMTGMAFGLGVAAIAELSGCCGCDWDGGGHGGNVNINNNRFNNINATNIKNGRAGRVDNASWRHDPSHRGGVAYRDSGSRQQFGQGQRVASREARGFDSPGGRGGAGGAGVGGAGRSGGLGGGGGLQQTPRAGTRDAGAGGGGRQAGLGSGGGREARAGSGAGRQAAAGSGGGARSSQRQQPSAFRGVDSGAQTRAEANRGRASQQSARASNASARSAPAASGGARGGGGRGGGGGGRGGGRR